MPLQFSCTQHVHAAESLYLQMPMLVLAPLQRRRSRLSELMEPFPRGL